MFCLQISVGSTNVRIGSTIFGARNYANKSPQAGTEQNNTQSSSSSTQQIEQNSGNVDDKLKSVTDGVNELKVEGK